jgi:hypothetical protein
VSDYEPMSAPPPERPGAQPRGEAPPSIRTSVNLVWAIVAMSVLSAVVTFIFFDDIIATAENAQGAANIDEGVVRATTIATTLFFVLVFGALWILFAMFLRKGANWARIGLSVMAGLGVVFGLFNLTSAPHAGLLVVGIITWVLEAALLWFLWQKDSSAYLGSGTARPAY